jgi:hypothetical protein
MSDGEAMLETEMLDPAAEARQPWSRPTVTKMDAADAEVGTRPTGPDGAFSVS